MESFDEFAASLRPQPSNAQVLIEVRTEGGDLDRALDVLKSAGFFHLRYEIVREEIPQWILIVLTSGDMRSAVLKLIEAGFHNLKGINAKKVTSPPEGRNEEIDNDA